MPDIESHNIPAGIRSELMAIISEHAELKARLELQSLMLNRVMRVAAIGLGLDPALNYKLNKDCSCFFLEVKDAEPNE